VGGRPGRPGICGASARATGTAAAAARSSASQFPRPDMRGRARRFSTALPVIHRHGCSTAQTRIEVELPCAPAQVALGCPAGLGIIQMRVLGIMVLGAAAVWSVLPTSAATADCREATSSYNSAISDAIRRYTRCLSSSNGHDDCSSEFRRLKNAQSDFESAVSDFESACN
jgi:hypothetical protein